MSGVAEPFAGLFTQGMVVHETYKDAAGSLGAAGEIRSRTTAAATREAFHVKTGEPIDDRPDREDVEVEEERGRPRRHHRELRRRHRALVHAVRFAARARRDLDRGRRRGREPLRPARLAPDLAPLPLPKARAAAADAALRKAAHKALASVEEDIERLRFNRCVAHIYTLANALEEALKGGLSRSVAREAGRHPGPAHRPDDAASGRGMLAALGARRPGRQASWPNVDRALLVEDEITLPVQINGKKRADVTVPRGADAETVEALVLATEAVQRALEGRTPRKVIVVPGRIVNLVA